MSEMSKVELYAAIRRDLHAGVSKRAIERKYGVGWRTVACATESVWPQPRKKYPPRPQKLDPYKPFIDEILRADLDASVGQRHTVTRIYRRLLDEHDMTDVSYQRVSAYVRERKPQFWWSSRQPLAAANGASKVSGSRATSRCGPSTSTPTPMSTRSRSTPSPNATGSRKGCHYV